jgi:hypothetical protein
MSKRTTFRFAAGGVSFELGGSEEFVRRHLPEFLPFVERVAGRHSSSPPAARADGAPDLTTWLESHGAGGVKLTMQDSILVFALWMRSFKKYIFTSEDIRRGFEGLGQPEPKSLLQILGTLKRDHNLILGTERRGEYMLNTTGIERARQLVGIATKEPSAAAAAAARTGVL